MFIYNSQSCFLTLDLPRDNEHGPLVMQQVLSTIHSAKIAMSFEVWAKKDIIQLAMHCKKKDKELLKNTVENHYEGIVIHDSEDAMPKNGYYQELLLDIADIFPIRRYSQATDDITRVHIDPYNELFAPLRKVKHNEIKGIQFIIMPYKFHRKADHTLRIFKHTDDWWLFQLWPSLGDDFIKLIYNSWLLRTFFLWCSYGRKIGSEKITHKRHDKESLAESAKAKIAQLSFKVSIRLIYSGKRPEKLNEIVSGFGQFNTKKLNAFRTTKSQKISYKLKKRRIGKAIDLCIQELAGMLAFPTKQVKIPELQRAAFKVLQSPQMNAQSGVLLGKTLQDEKKFYLSRKDMKGHVAIVGRTGAGKSTVVLQFIQDLINHGKGLCVIDPHGDLVDFVTTTIPQDRILDTVLIDPSDTEYPIAFNIFASGIPKDQVLASVNETFKKIFADFWGTRTEQVLRNTLRLAICDPKANLMSITKILSDNEYRKKLLIINQDPLVDMYWTQEFPTTKRLVEEHVSPLQNKISQFLETPSLRNILGQSKNKINFQQAIQEQKCPFGKQGILNFFEFFLHRKEKFGICICR